MNRQRVEQLLGKMAKLRAQNLAGQPPAGQGNAAAAERQTFRASNEAGVTTLYIYDVIGGWYGVFAKDVAAALIDAGDVVVHINSPGGGIFEGAAIHNLFKNHRGKVTMRIDGVAASAASFIAMAGDSIIMEPNSTMMIHEGSDIVFGGAADLRDAAEVLDMLNRIIASMYAARADSPIEEWLDQMARETWYDAAKALAAGLVDEVPLPKGKQPAEPADMADLLSMFDVLAKPVAATSPQVQAEAEPVADGVDVTEPAEVVAAETAPAETAPAAPGASEPVTTDATATTSAEPAAAPAVVVIPAAATATAAPVLPTADTGLGFAALLRKELV